MGDAAIPGEQEIDTDVCVVGAGPAGITIARELDRHGIRACLLESGGENVERRRQAQSRGESDGSPIHLPHRSRVRAFGGTLRHPRILGGGGWAARPLDPIDFEVRPGMPDSGWPFGRRRLMPYYERALRACGLPSRDWEGGSPSDEPRLDDSPARGSEVESTVFQFSTADFQDTHETLAASSTVRLLLRRRVAEVTVDENGRRVETVVAVRDDRGRVVVRPRLVVFAAGGIENARLLLAARGGRGLGNEHDVVGRYFAERLTLPVGHIAPSGTGSLDDDVTFFDRRDGVSGAVRIAEGVQRERGLRNSAFALVPRPASLVTPGVRSLATLRKATGRRPLVDGAGTHVRNVLTGARDVADFVMSQVTTRPGVLILRAQGEQAPNRDSRITLGSRRDDLGAPVARVTWRTAEADYRALQSSVDIVDGALRAGGFGPVRSTLDSHPATLVEGNHHHLGATRMHTDPRKGVVDPNCRVHSVDNLYIAGCSVFPTYGLSNPTLTIVALAFRLAEHLRDVLDHHADELPT